jgi:hypothetical protein
VLVLTLEYVKANLILYVWSLKWRNDETGHDRGDATDFPRFIATTAAAATTTAAAADSFIPWPVALPTTPTSTDAAPVSAAKRPLTGENITHLNCTLLTR